MFKTFAILALLLGSSLSAAQDWSCNASVQPPECSGNIQTQFSATENSCLLKLYTCGRYQDIVARMDTLKIGLAPEHNYYLGAAYFGLSNRTDAQSLKCHYFRRAKAQIDEFLIGIEADPASQVNYGSEQRMDIIYHATRLAELLKKETGCVESSFSEGMIYRTARLMTQEQMKDLLHQTANNDTSAPGPKEAAQNGFHAMRDSMNSFVTKTSQLESRYYLYEAQLDASKDQFKNLGLVLQKGFGDGVTIGAGEFGLPTVDINTKVIDERMKAMSQELESQAIVPLDSYRAIADQYFKKNQPSGNNNEPVYYEDLRQEKIGEVKGLLALFATYTNSITVKSPEAEAVHAVLQTPEAGFETPLLVRGPVKEFFDLGTQKNCTPFQKKNYWYCK